MPVFLTRTEKGLRGRFWGNHAPLFYIFPLVLLLSLSPVFSPASSPGDSPYRKVHFDAIVADTHNDVVQRILAGEDIGKRTATGHSDLPRFREGGIDIQVFSIWAAPTKRHASFFEQANEQIDSILSLVRRNTDKVGLATSEKEIEALLMKGKFIAVLGLEGGHYIGNDLSKLDHFYSRGVRYMGFTWDNSTDWATSAYDEVVQPEKLRHRGLTAFGRSVVRRMNELGMMIDISHVGETTFWDIIRETKKPIIASHSSVWSLCPHRRNLKDEQLKAIAATGGVVFINFFPAFIDSTFADKERRLREAHRDRIGTLQASWRGEAHELGYAIAEMLKEEYQTIRPPLSVLIDHIDYAIKLIGVEHVGLGSDFDGIRTTPLEMDDVTHFPNITRELLKRGYSEGDVRKVLGGNFLRVVREVCQ